MASSGLSTQGLLKAIGMKNPPTAPTAPMMPTAAEDFFVAPASAASRSAVPGVVACSASRRKIAGIIL